MVRSKYDAPSASCLTRKLTRLILVHVRESRTSNVGEAYSSHLMLFLIACFCTYGTIPIGPTRTNTSVLRAERVDMKRAASGLQQVTQITSRPQGPLLSRGCTAPGRT